MSKLSDIGYIKKIMNKHGFEFSKSLGQNFLINPSVCPKIAEFGGAAPGVGVIEVGAGIGVLTSELASRADKVVSIELDKRLIPVLEQTLGEYDNIKVVNEDILKVDLKSLIEREFAGLDVVVCANLPYYITSPVIMRLLEEKLPIKAITVMVQKEAALRLTAKLGTRECGAVTVAVRYFSEPKLLFNVSRGSFMPAPNVDSSVIRLDIGAQESFAVEDERQFFRVVKAAFGQRRKQLANALSAGLGITKEQVGDAMNQAGLRPTARAEELKMEDFTALANTLLMLQKND